MSIAVTKQTITGSSLPVGDMVSYAKDNNTGLWRVFQCTQSGSVSHAAFPTFPPSSFSGSLAYLETLLCQTSPGVNFSLTGVSRFVATNAENNVPYVALVGSDTRAPSPGIGIYATNPSVYPGNYLRRILNNVVPSLLGAFKRRVVAGLGQSESGTPNYYIVSGEYAATGFLTTPIQASLCTVVNNNVLSYGACEVGNDLYVLLKPNGQAYKISPSSAGSLQFTVPSGGEIKQFADGYYIASNGSGDLFLYNINNNGTLIDQLDPGVYNPSTAIELFAAIPTV